MNTRTRTEGFTLIELLVVIAIIGVLAAVLLPSYLGAQKRSQDVSALQCGRAIMTAQTDYRARNATYYNGAISGLGQDTTEACAGVQVQPLAAGFTPAASTTGTGQVFGNAALYNFWVWNQKGATAFQTDSNPAVNYKLYAASSF